MSQRPYNYILSTMSDAKLVAKNFILLYTSELIGQFLSFFLVIAIARYFGDIGLGKYSFAFSFVSLFLIIADMGLPTLITKEVAKDRKLAQLHLTKTFTLKLILNVITFAVTLAVIFASRRDYETIIFVGLAALAMVFFNLAGIFRAIFQAYEIMEYEALMKVIERIIAVSLGIFLFYRGYGLIALFIVLVFSNLMYYLSIFALTKAKISGISLSFDKKSWKQNLKESVPFWVTTIFITLYFKIDTVMLTFIKGFEAAGWYNAALKIIEVITRIPFLLNVAVFPAFSKFYRNSHDKTKLFYTKSFYFMIVLALPMATGLVLLADRIIVYVFSQEFANSIAALQILAASLVFVFVNYLMGYLLNAIDRQRLFTLTVTTTAIINILLNLMLIPKYSYIGAASATLISEVINFGMLYYFTSKNQFRVSIPKILAKPIVATVIMIAAIIYFKSLHLLFIVAISSIAYFITLFLLKGISRDEIGILQSFFQRK